MSEQPAYSPRTEETRHRALSTWAWTLFFLFIVYPLSVGPAGMLDHRLPAMRHVIKLVYAPLVLISNNVPAVDNFFKWYIGFWW